MWKSTTLNMAGASHTHDVYQQHDINNCGPSSIIMTVNQGLKKSVSIGFAQTLVGQIEKAGGKRTGAQADARWHAWGDSSLGGYSDMDDLCTAIKKKWPGLNATTATGTSSHQDLLQAATPSSPVLAHVAWIGGGGHFIVCLGKNAANQMVWLDPYNGVVVNDYHGDATEDAVYYNTAQNSFGKSAAQAWSWHGIYTTPA